MANGVVSMEGYQQSTSPTIKRLLEQIQTMTSGLGSALAANGNSYQENSDKSPLVAKTYMLVLMLTRWFFSGALVVSGVSYMALKQSGPLSVMTAPSWLSTKMTKCSGDGATEIGSGCLALASKSMWATLIAWPVSMLQAVSFPIAMANGNKKVAQMKPLQRSRFLLP